MRLWAMDLFATVRAKVAVEIAPEEIRRLLDHDDERMQQFGAQLFEAQRDLEKLPLATLCAAFAKHVSSERLTLAQCVELACAQPVPVARLGQHLVLARALTPADYAALAGLADARCLAVAGELATWALARVGAPEHCDLAVVSRLFDSLGAR